MRWKCIALLAIILKLSNAGQKKNIVVIITDDQDVELGSMESMPKTLRLMKDKGTEFKGGFVTTPICCPSRSTILTGLYAHNHNIHTNNHNCSGTEWRKFHESNTFGSYLHNLGYRTSYFGKYLNEYDGSYVPQGWDHWFGLVKNSKFYNYTVNWNGEKIKHGSEYDKDYFTDVIANRSLEFISKHLESETSQPFLSVLSFPAPHGPEDPAPQYADMFENNEQHRTEAWNYAPNPDKQWLLQRTGKMDTVHVAFTDLLQRRRLQTLQSVDLAVQKLFVMLRDYNQLSSTYVLYTSDHGYHLGQFGLIKGKNMPYEFDIRVPFYLRGPGIPRNYTVYSPVSNLDICTTVLDMAGSPLPSHLDGQSLLSLLRSTTESGFGLESWRDTILIERGKMPKLKKIRDRLKNQKERFSKEVRLNKECSKPIWHGNCEPGQLWQCIRSLDRWRIVKCRQNITCQCDHRYKRSTDTYDSVTNEFLQYTYQESMINTKQWMQGVFQLDLPSRINKLKRNRRDCLCEKNTTHPLNEHFMDNLFYEETSSLIRKKNRNSSDSFRSSCSLPQMNCFIHGSDHWRTPPYWPESYGKFCFCQNSNNNTYWCLRTWNQTHNTLYCEFVTQFVSYYDMNEDPYQLTNLVYSLDPIILEELSARLSLLRNCVASECHALSKPDWKNNLTPTQQLLLNS